MLPALDPDRLSLADVMPSSIAALTGMPNRLGLPPVRRAIVVLADGLGSAVLAARAGHARTLAGMHDKRAVLQSGFPTTTAAALATLTTGTNPGRHGLVGYTVLDADNNRVVNQLTGWDDHLDPATWQRMPTVFESATSSGIQSVAVGHPRYADSGFTRAVLRGAEYRPGPTMSARCDIAVNWLRESNEPGILYVYIPELDMAAHASGWQSEKWTHQLESLDACVRTLSEQLGPGDGVLVTADHGVIDVPPSSHITIDSSPELLDGVRFVAGDPRCLQLHVEPDATESARRRLMASWRSAESDRAWVASRAEAIAAGWFGAVDPEVEPRIGDIVVAARKAIAYYDATSASASSMAMIGQHGSLSQEEVRVPLLRMGAFAQRR